MVKLKWVFKCRVAISLTGKEAERKVEYIQTCSNACEQKIQDELIAREIVINDADSAVRYKLTKRQTQEEIQKCTGAVVITRGKYRPPSAAPDGEKPLYLHISAGAHLETTVERIKAVDLAAAMVEEMLKQGSINNVGMVTNHLSTCVYLGFEADPSLNIAARIRGPNRLCWRQSRGKFSL
ncbi:hypothetical protein LOK49_LG02G03729 [Camellia lanceoleosa]|uniref:Uncharacterized protein n=1 Tax=Camellia lanceoleosa TaxID=1840588 RepID=A0ACC0IPL9_9ERIC|nr:hypothetical protein LOK49_LG02G03729 [Camellia lanceoleosa]